MRSTDTDPTAERIQVELLREATVARRISLALSLSKTVMELSWRAVQRTHPSADADEIAVRFVTLCYGPELGESVRRDLEERRQASRT